MIAKRIETKSEKRATEGNEGKNSIRHKIG